ncbi:hypothetical protein JX266_005131 [Neoarthrinium moseri]|nr:hypothetical protein JX266_005131 [Neoarthrinium moseri]
MGNHLRLLRALLLAGPALAAYDPAPASEEKQSASFATVAPTIPHGHDAADINHLKPAESCALHFVGYDGEGSAEVQHYATMHATFAHPAVVLHHSSLVSEVACAEDGLSLEMKSEAALKYCQEHWDPSSMVFISTSCGAKNDGHNAYFKVSGITYDESTLTAHCKATEMEVPDVMTGGKIKWSTYGKEKHGIAKRAISSCTTSTTSTTTSSSTTPCTTLITTTTTSSSTTPCNSPTTTGGGSATSCGAPPAATISGLPAAACGTKFDRALDNSLGYLEFNDDSDFSAFVQQFAPGIADRNVNDYQLDDVKGLNFNSTLNTTRSAAKERGIMDRRAARIQKRFSVLGFLQSAASTVLNLFSSSGDTSVPDNVSTAVQNTGDSIGSGTFVASGTQDQFSPFVGFGRAFELDANQDPTFLSVNYQQNGDQGLFLLCEGCKFAGELRVSGEVDFSVLENTITGGRLELDGSLSVGGTLNAQYFGGSFAVSPTQQELATTSIPVFTMPGVIDVSFDLEIDAIAGISVSDQSNRAQFRTTITAVSPGFTAQIDLSNSNVVQSGFDPLLSTDFTTTGAVSLDQGQFSLPNQVSINFNLIPLGPSGHRLLNLTSFPAATFDTAAALVGDCFTAGGLIFDSAVTDNIVLDTFQSTTVPLAQVTGPSNTAVCLRPGATISSRAISDSNDASGALRSSPANMRRRQETCNDTDDSLNGSGSQAFFYYTPLTDLTGNWALYSDDDGSLRVVRGNASATPDATANNTLGDAGAYWGSYDQIITSDGSARVLHYYPDTIDAYGVSRLRISPIDKMPKSSDCISLVPVNYDNSPSTPGVYVAVDTVGKLFWPIICNIAGQPSKIFVASDPVTGPAKLTDPDLRYTVTGGVVQNCTFIPFKSNQPGLLG